MARIFDVIELADEARDELVHRFPEEGSGDFRIGSQVIVRESQNAVFFRDGRALDTFGPGRHTIATANIPRVIDFIGKAFNDRTPFTAEVYFTSMREFADRKWGTPQPIIVSNPGMGLGVALLQGFGTYSYAISDPQQFVTQLVGSMGVFRTSEIEDRLRAVLLSDLTDLLGETAAAHSVVQLIGLVNEISAGVRAKAQDHFASLGLTLKSFIVSNLKPSNKSAEELRAMGMLDMHTYTQLQAADAMRDAAQNPSGGAGLTAGIGAGMGVGNVLQQSLSGMAAPGGQQAAVAGGAAAGGAAGGVMPDVMTPDEAAGILKVAAEDVVAAIEAGDLKAKKLGNAYRISKKALEEFLNG
jgi:excisionase family DNA binding protein